MGSEMCIRDSRCPDGERSSFRWASATGLAPLRAAFALTKGWTKSKTGRLSSTTTPPSFMLCTMTMAKPGSPSSVGTRLARANARSTTTGRCLHLVSRSARVMASLVAICRSNHAPLHREHALRWKSTRLVFTRELQPPIPLVRPKSRKHSQLFLSPAPNFSTATPATQPTR